MPLSKCTFCPDERREKVLALQAHREIWLNDRQRTMTSKVFYISPVVSCIFLLWQCTACKFGLAQSCVYLFLTILCLFLNPKNFSNLNSDCSNLLDMRNLQEQLKKAFCYKKLFWPFTIWINISSDLKILQILGLQPRIPKVFLNH